MSEETLDRLFEQIFALPLEKGRFTVVWHAGEPLVLGADYYRRAFEIIAGRNTGAITVDHSFQTNGILLSPDWVEFFRATRAGLGVSLDGPRDLHDRNRRTRRGAGTFDAAMRGVQLLREGGVPFHVITVLTRDSLAHAPEIFEFYVEWGIAWVGFNIDELEGDHRGSSMAFTGVDALARDFFETFLRLNADAGHPIEVREFEGVVQAVLTSDAPHPANQQSDPLRIINVDADGNFSTFSPELLGFSDRRYGPFTFGNVWCERLADMVEHPGLLAIDADIRRGIDACRRSCEYFSLCLGGAPGNKLFENGSFDSTETLYCRLTKKAVVDVVLSRMERPRVDPRATAPLAHSDA